MSIIASMYISEKVDIRKTTGYILIITIILTIFVGARAVYINPTDSREPIIICTNRTTNKRFF